MTDYDVTVSHSYNLTVYVLIELVLEFEKKREHYNQNVYKSLFFVLPAPVAFDHLPRGVVVVVVILPPGARAPLWPVVAPSVEEQDAMELMRARS